MKSDRLVDRIVASDWNNITNDLNKVVAKKLFNKIEDYKTQYKEKGTFSETD